MEHHLIFVDNEEGDWEGVYVSGKLFAEGHKLSREDYVSMIQKYRLFSEQVSTLTLTEEQMKELGYRLPEDYHEIFDVIEGE